MKRYNINLVCLVFFLILSHVEALHRDYGFDRNELGFGKYPQCYHHYYYDCPEIAGYQCEFGIKLTKYWFWLPEVMPECGSCRSGSIYPGYIDPDFAKYNSHLFQQLEYCDNLSKGEAWPHECCDCYWPEYSEKAAQISNIAYLLFQDIISTTSLCTLYENEIEQKEFVKNTKHYLNKHELAVSFIAQQFRYSDYYHVCRDIENYSNQRYEEREVAKIRDKLEDILETLSSQFFELYISCYAKHPTQAIEQEIRFIKLLNRDMGSYEDVFSMRIPSDNSYDNHHVINSIIADLETDDRSIKDVISSCRTSEIFTQACKTNNSNELYSKVLNINTNLSNQPENLFSIQSEIFLEQGTLLNDLLFYNEAIQILTQAIQLNPSNRNAYIERAMAYFETGQLELALKDYVRANDASAKPPFRKSVVFYYVPENKAEFSKGLVAGTLDGAKESTREFIPSIFSCCKGILNGLWAFACSPTEVSKDMVNTAYAIGEFISSQSSQECLQLVVPELKDLSLTWKELNDHSRGHKIGHIIGKYGIEIFAPIGILKGASKIRALKRANTMCTLENCATSQAKQTKILEESVKRAALREKAVIDSIKNGKILIKSSNVQYHVMQPKHAWDKVLKLSGNVEKDFKKLVSLLEENNILDKSFLKDKPQFFPQNNPKISKTAYEKVINNCKIRAEFETYLETGEIFLKDAWVVTK